MIRPRALLGLGLLAALTLLVAAAPLLAQCALCGEALANADPSGGDPALGFSWGILVLLGVVGCLAAGLAGFIVYAVRVPGSGSGPPPGSAR